MNSEDDSDEEIIMPVRVIKPTPSDTATNLTPQELSTAKTINMNEPSAEEIDKMFFGMNGLDVDTGTDETIRPYHSFHNATAQVKFNANESISYRGNARMLDTGSLVSDEVQREGLKLRQLVEDTVSAHRKTTAKQNVSLLKVEYEHIIQQLEENKVDGHLSREELGKLKDKKRELRETIYEARRLLA